MASGARGSGALVRADGEFFLLAPADRPLFRDILGGIAHPHIGAGHPRCQFRIGQRIEPHHRHARHALDTRADESVSGPHLDSTGCNMDGGHGRTAETIDGHGAQSLRQARDHADRSGQIETLFTFGKRASQNQILDIVRIDFGPRHETSDHLPGDIVGTNRRQPPFSRQGKRRTRITCDDDLLH